MAIRWLERDDAGKNRIDGVSVSRSVVIFGDAVENVGQDSVSIGYDADAGLLVVDFSGGPWKLIRHGNRYGLSYSVAQKLIKAGCPVGRSIRHWRTGTVYYFQMVDGEAS